jgi:hypothetical protein
MKGARRGKMGAEKEKLQEKETCNRSAPIVFSAAIALRARRAGRHLEAARARARRTAAPPRARAPANGGIDPIDQNCQQQRGGRAV